MNLGGNRGPWVRVRDLGWEPIICWKSNESTRDSQLILRTRHCVDYCWHRLLLMRVRDSQLVLRTHINALLMGRVKLLSRAITKFNENTDSK